jgi:hypothetical protein
MTVPGAFPARRAVIGTPIPPHWMWALAGIWNSRVRRRYDLGQKPLSGLCDPNARMFGAVPSLGMGDCKAAPGESPHDIIRDVVGFQHCLSAAVGGGQ